VATADVILVPGAVLPAGLAYPALVDALGPDVNAVAKDLELYASDQPPPDYSLDTEVEGILRVAGEAGMERFHLVGYSAGGASALALASRYPERLASLALLEAASAGSDGLGPEEQAAWLEFDRISRLPDEELMPVFVRAQLAPGVDPPAAPPGPPPPWMAKRPRGLRAVIQALTAYELDTDALRRFTRPVYYAVGGLSNPDYYARQAQRLATIFPDFTIEVYEARHHFDPPHRAEPERLAAALRRLWTAQDTEEVT
jgi:pimeloyl-ACP methyl ester carboxylesterase